MKQNIDFPNMLYHYCCSDALFGIISSRTIRLNNAFETNDYLERKWIDPIIDEVLNNFSTKDKHFKTFRSCLLDHYRRNRNVVPYFAAFSEVGDLLSQWRGYAEDGKGFAIGFNPKYFKLNKQIPFTSVNPEETIGIFKMRYNRDYVYGRTEGAIKIFWNHYEADNFSDQSFAMIQCAGFLVRVASLVKNPAFIEENEWRILFTPSITSSSVGSANVAGNIKKMNFYPKENEMISSFFEFLIENSADEKSIIEIILGPKNQTTKDTIEIFLNQNGFNDVQIKKSSASYR